VFGRRTAFIRVIWSFIFGRSFLCSISGNSRLFFRRLDRPCCAPLRGADHLPTKLSAFPRQTLQYPPYAPASGGTPAKTMTLHPIFGVFGIESEASTMAIFVAAVRPPSEFQASRTAPSPLPGSIVSHFICDELLGAVSYLLTTFCASSVWLAYRRPPGFFLTSLSDLFR